MPSTTASSSTGAPLADHRDLVRNRGEQAGSWDGVSKSLAVVPAIVQCAAMRRWTRGSLEWLWAMVLMASLASSSLARALVWPSVVEDVARDLASQDPGERRAAAARLARLPRAAAHRLLPQALADVDARVRVLAADAAIATRYHRAAVIVDPWLGDKESDVRRAAARVLSSFPDAQRSLTRLSRALADPDASVRLAVVDALGASSSEHATTALLSQLDDSDVDVAVAVIEALERLGDPRSVVPLIGRLQDNRSSTRRAAARALGSLGGEAAVGALLVALRDSDARVRLAVVSALGHARSDTAISALTSQLDSDDDVDVRVAALHALAAIGSPGAVGVLIEQLASRRDELATEAGRALSGLSQESAPQLVECLTAREGAVADGCAVALGTVQADESYAALTRALDTRSISTLAALEAYGALRDVRALPVVLEQLVSEHDAVRHAALLAAGELLDPAQPDGRAVEPLARALEVAGTRVEEQVALIELLGRTGTARAGDIVAGFATERAPVRHRLAALTALGRVASEKPAHQQLLVDALDAEQGSVRFAAALSLRRAGKPGWVEPLLAKLQAATADRQAVALALAGPLSRVTDPAVLSRLRQVIGGSAGPTRDALIEALAHVPSPGADAMLGALITEHPAAKAKVAEVLGRRRGTGGPLSELLSDEVAAVRANAAWSALERGESSLVERLLELTADPDVSVAANATAALSRVGSTRQVIPRLCRLVDDARAHVRANALVALRLRQTRCEGRPARWVLERDHSPLVRERAAQLLAALPADDGAEARLLSRVARADASERVARAASGQKPTTSPGQRQWLSVFVVPSGRRAPLALAPYAIDTGDGLLRLGLTDERGAVFVAAVAGMEVRLELPPGFDY